MPFLTTLVARTGDATSTIYIAWTIFGKMTDFVSVSSELMDSVSVRRISSKLISDSTFGQFADDLATGAKEG